jgi:hypothetical protein
MVRYALSLFLCLGLFGCGEKETCDPLCGILRDKKVQWSHMTLNPYRYTIDMDCTGERVVYSGASSGDYDRYLIGDEICTDDIVRL